MHRTISWNSGTGTGLTGCSLFGPTYTVSYDGNGSEGGTVPAPQSKIHDAGLTLAGNSGNLVRYGWNFAGWNTQADGQGTDYAAGALYTLDEDMTLYAVWTVKTYSVTYNANGATGGTAPAPQEKTHGIDLTLAGNTGNLVRSGGYTFDRWNTLANGNGTYYGAGGTYSVDSDVILYAQWLFDL